VVDAFITLVVLGTLAVMAFAVVGHFLNRVKESRNAAAEATATQAEVARLTARREAALLGDDDQEVAAVLTAIEQAPPDVARHIPTYDLRARAAAHARHQQWAARRAVDAFEGEAVYHVDNNVRLRKRGDAYGRLLCTATRLVYLGDRRVDLPWARFFHVHFGEEEVGDWDSVATVAIQLAGQKSSTKFYLDDSADSKAAQWWIETLTKATQQGGPDAASPLSEAPAVVSVTQDADHAGLDFETDIVGESHDDRPETLRAIQARGPHSVSAQGVRFSARLVPEPNNRFDPNAVLVVDDASNRPIGYLGRALAASYQAGVLEAQRKGLSLVVPAVVRGSEGRLGVWLDLSAFNESAGLPTPEELLSGSSDYFDRRMASGQVEGIPWGTHHAQAVEASRLGQHEVAGESFAKAMRGWLSALAFDRRPPGTGALFEDYAKWCRKAKRMDVELEVLQRYATDVAPHEEGSTRCARMGKRLSAIRGEAIDEAPF
jgi:hypothetical protein